jgi:hypothetical protein
MTPGISSQPLAIAISIWPFSEAAILIENALWAQSSSKLRNDKITYI